MELKPLTINQSISDVNIKFFVNPDIESWNPIKIRISVHSGI